MGTRIACFCFVTAILIVGCRHSTTSSNAVPVVAVAATAAVVQQVREERAKNQGPPRSSDCCAICDPCTFPCGNTCVPDGTICTRPKGCACAAPPAGDPVLSEPANPAMCHPATGNINIGM